MGNKKFKKQFSANVSKSEMQLGNIKKIIGIYKGLSIKKRPIEPNKNVLPTNKTI